MSFKVTPAAGAPIIGAMPAPPVTTESRAESSEHTAEVQRMELAERYRQVIENGWREITNATSVASAREDICPRVFSELRALCNQELRAIALSKSNLMAFARSKGFDLSKDFDFSRWTSSMCSGFSELKNVVYSSVGFIQSEELCLPQKERDQILLFLAKLPAAKHMKEPAETYVAGCYLMFNRYGGCLPHVLEAVILNAIANDHTELLKKLHLSFIENPQFFALAYLIAFEKKGQVLDMMMTTLITIPPVSMKTFSLLTMETFSLLAKGMRKKISIVNEYVQREPFDLDTVMIVWKTLGLDEGLEKEAVIASLEARIGSLPDGEEKGKFEAFRNKIREGR